METAKLKYAGVTLEAPKFIVDNDLWPFDLPIEEWPTFCGAGEGFGDFIVPDSILGVNIRPACFVHDVEFSVNNRNYLAFSSANYRLHNNIVSLIEPRLFGTRYLAAMIIADDYAVAVQAFGWPNFTPDASVDNWQSSKKLKDKLHRLAMHNLRYDRR